MFQVFKQESMARSAAQKAAHKCFPLFLHESQGLSRAVDERGNNTDERSAGLLTDPSAMMLDVPGSRSPGGPGYRKLALNSIPLLVLNNVDHFALNSAAHTGKNTTT